MPDFFTLGEVPDFHMEQIELYGWRRHICSISFKTIRS